MSPAAGLARVWLPDDSEEEWGWRPKFWPGNSLPSTQLAVGTNGSPSGSDARDFLSAWGLEQYTDEFEMNQEEVETYGAFCIIPYLLPPHTVHCVDKSEKDKPKKTTWRPSRSEIKDGFITEVPGTLDLQKCLSHRIEKLTALGLPLQPLVVTVKQDNLNDYYVVIDNIYFQFKTILEAVDCCFKCIHALNAKYPLEAAALWTFIQKGFYKLKTPWDQRFVSVSTLFSALGISPDLE